MIDRFQSNQLSESGFLLIKNHLSNPKVEALRDRLEALWNSEGEAAGVENYLEPGTRRLANLANKGDVFRQIYADPLVLEAVHLIIGPEIRVSMVNARDARPFGGTAMPFHCDTDQNRKPDERGYNSATAIWMLDRFLKENGATAIVPGSHRSGRSPKESLVDPAAVHPDEVIVLGEPGDVLVFNGHCWHAGRPNRTSGQRRAILVHYLRADIPRELNRRQVLDSEAAARLTPLEGELLGLRD